MVPAFDRIVVPYDDTEGSNKALDLAISLTKTYPGVDLIVANVFQEKIENIPVDIFP